jgi:hypothetical protein
MTISIDPTYENPKINDSSYKSMHGSLNKWDMSLSKNKKRNVIEKEDITIELKDHHNYMLSQMD